MPELEFLPCQSPRRAFKAGTGSVKGSSQQAEYTVPNGRGVLEQEVLRIKGGKNRENLINMGEKISAPHSLEPRPTANKRTSMPATFHTKEEETMCQENTMYYIFDFYTNHSRYRKRTVDHGKRHY